MSRSRFALVAIFCGSACLIGDDEPSVDTHIPDDDGRTNISAAVELPDGGYNICEHLPAEAPCSLLCDRDALVEQYVPESSCAVFVCELTDGRRISVHACHPPD